MPSAKEISRALARIRAVMPAAKKVDAADRNIRLGLDRIARVVPADQPWAGIHVGGTNGKGSICALLAGLLRLAGLSHGVYTSPAMPERHHGVTINGLYVNPRMYDEELRHVEAKFRRVSSGFRFAASQDPGDLTPFELETAAAFRVFSKMHVKYAVVEVGMGGATDATNIMRKKSVTVISKIDLDHQEFLGDTLEEIAKVKAGIMRPGVPCIVDHTNPGSVLSVLREHANEIGTQVHATWKALPLLADLDTERFKLEEYQKQNLLCALLAFRHLFPNLDIDVNRLLATDPYPPGRKEKVGVLGLTGGLRKSPVLVDGAHNLLGVEALAAYVENQVRDGDEPVSWVMGLSASKSKPFARLIDALVRPQDNFAFVEYAPGPNEPAPAPAELGRDIARAIVRDADRQLYDGEPTVGPAVQWACEKAGEGPVVVTGSLYLIRNLYRLDGIRRKRRPKTRRPGPAQLLRYTQLAQQRTLTPEESREFKQARRHWHLSPGRNPYSKLGAPVPASARELQRTAAFHKRQADGYAKAIQSVKRDMEKAAAGPHTGESSDLSSTLQKSIDDLLARQGEHLKVYNSSMFKLRGYIADPSKKFLSYEEIVGVPERPANKALPSQGSETGATGPEHTQPLRTETKTRDSGRGSRRSTYKEKKTGQADVATEADDLVNKLTSGRQGP